MRVNFVHTCLHGSRFVPDDGRILMMHGCEINFCQQFSALFIVNSVDFCHLGSETFPSILNPCGQFQMFILARSMFFRGPHVLFVWMPLGDRVQRGGASDPGVASTDSGVDRIG
jgi:hypothetical protein